MSENIGEIETQNTQSDTTPEVDVEVDTNPEEDIEELRKRADVSSQNFERAKKAEREAKELQAKLDELTDNLVPSGNEEDELPNLKSKLSAIEQKLAKSEVIDSFPALKEHWSDFEEFRGSNENVGMPLPTAAKAFLIEKGLLGATRKGLEKSTGGPRKPLSSGMTNDEVKDIRVNDPKKYRDMIKKGVIKFQS